MEKKQPQKCTPELKAQIAMAAISGQMTVQEIMKKYGVSKTAVYTRNHALIKETSIWINGAKQIERAVRILHDNCFCIIQDLIKS